MLPALAILILPPTFGGSAYLFWYQGQQLVLSSQNQQQRQQHSETDQSWTSYAAGIASLGMTYGLQSKLIFPFFDGRHQQQLTQHLGLSQQQQQSQVNQKDSSTRKQTKKTKSRTSTTMTGKTNKSFVPPQNLGDVYRRIGPPVLARLGAASLAFFTAGVVQTYVASNYQGDQREKQKNR